MDLAEKLAKLKAQQQEIEARIANQQAARNAVLGGIVGYLIEHPQIRRHVQSETFLARLNRAQRDALSALLDETPVKAPEPPTNTDHKDAGGVSGGQKPVETHNPSQSPAQAQR